jgi:hypothetical protein
MKQEKIAQNRKSETTRRIGKVETMRENSKKLLSPKGAIVCRKHNRANPITLLA